LFGDDIIIPHPVYLLYSIETNYYFKPQNPWNYAPQKNLSEKWSTQDILLPAVLNLLHINNCLSTSAIKVATMNATHNFFSLRRETTHAITKSTHFPVSKMIWKIHCTYCGMPRGTSQADQWKNQACTLSCYWVMLVWKHLQLCSQSVENSSK